MDAMALMGGLGMEPTSVSILDMGAPSREFQHRCDQLVLLESAGGGTSRAHRGLSRLNDEREERPMTTISDTGLIRVPAFSRPS
jgi:hypothetical protein